MIVGLSRGRRGFRESTAWRILKDAIELRSSERRRGASREANTRPTRIQGVVKCGMCVQYSAPSPLTR